MNLNWIYKYQIPHRASTIEMYKGYNIIHVGLDPNGTPCIWVEVDPNAVEVNVTVYSLWTGDTVLPDTRYVGTYTYQGRVNHVYVAI